MQIQSLFITQLLLLAISNSPINAAITTQLLDEKNNTYYSDTFSDISTPLDSIEVLSINPGYAINDYKTKENGMPILHSNPGLTNFIFLDFDGHNYTRTEEYGWLDFSAYPFDPMNDDPSPYNPFFSHRERLYIINIWQRVSEDFAPFNVDVTTEEPNSKYNKTIAHCLITKNKDINGRNMPRHGVGGLAYLNTFGKRDNLVFSPAIVYWNNIGNTNNIAEVCSHEIGHNMGLTHDGYEADIYKFAYYHGDANKEVDSWGPIMGIAFYNRLSQWSKGEYYGATNKEDDLFILEKKLGYILDDYGNDVATAYTLEFQSTEKQFIASVAGIISNRNDIDMFKFALERDCEINININTLQTIINKGGGNLNVNYALYSHYTNDAYYVYKKPNLEQGVNSILVLPKGEYYIGLYGIGHPNFKYSDYASLGAYTLTIIIIPYKTTSTQTITATQTTSYQQSGSTIFTSIKPTITTTEFNRILSGTNNIVLELRSGVNCSSYKLLYTFNITNKESKYYTVILSKKGITKKGKIRYNVLRKYKFKNASKEKNLVFKINELLEGDYFKLQIKGIGSWLLTYFTDYLNQILTC